MKPHDDGSPTIRTRLIADGLFIVLRGEYMLGYIRRAEDGTWVASFGPTPTCSGRTLQECELAVIERWSKL